ncbi:MAG: CBS domain-containing protein [Candidatus Hydrogenedentes bacterium]|nr:CBS domain-containing protein [Candidatus Hydrogenedentota bacterium]
MKTIGEIIGTREPYFVEPEQTVREVVEYLATKGVGAVAVCENGAVVGVFSERDLVRRVVAEGRDSQTTRIREVMTGEVVSVSIEDSHHVAKALMLDKKFRHLVAIDREKRFRGFVSMRELLEVDLAESRALIHSLNDGYYEHQFKPGD